MSLPAEPRHEERASSGSWSTLIVVGFVAWLASHMSFQNMQVPVPLRGEAARNPFYAAIRLSDLLGAEATWERVFTAPPADGRDPGVGLELDAESHARGTPAALG